jgi:hypothetical protein
MKTKGLGKLVILGLILTSLVSCKEEEFYEKEFIDTLSDQYERENLPDDVAENPFESPSTNPGNNDSVPPVDVGTNPVPPVVVVPPVEPPVVLEDITDSFNQKENGTTLDILWVIDDSGSMFDEQKALGSNFEAFIKEFVNKDIDFQMAVTTTDTSRDRAGAVYKDSMDRLTSAKLKEDKEQFMKDFATLVNVGTKGSAYERGIQASDAFSEKFSESWMRKDAYFTIVYMSDERDQSADTAANYLKKLQSLKSNDGLIKAFSIINLNTYRNGSSEYQKYNDISNLTGGKIASIKGDFHTTLLEMGEQIADLTEQFPLSKKPYDSANIEIYVDGVIDSAWSYDSSSNSVKFDAYSIPAAGAKIEIRYNSVK